MMNTHFFSKLQFGDSQGWRRYFGRFSAVILLTMGLLLFFAEATPVSANNHENNVQGVNTKVASSWWKYSYTYNPSRVEDRMVAGDFDGDALMISPPFTAMTTAPHASTPFFLREKALTTAVRLAGGVRLAATRYLALY